MNIFLSRPAFEVLAQLDSRGLDTITGSELRRYHPPSFDEILESGLISPDGLSSHVLLEDLEHHLYYAPVMLSPSGQQGYLCADQGWLAVSENMRRRYRFHGVIFHEILKRWLKLKGECRDVKEGLAFLGVCKMGALSIDVFWSHPMCRHHAQMVKEYMQQRALPVPTVILHMGRHWCSYDLGEDVTLINLEDLWSHDGVFEDKRLWQIIARQMCQKGIGDQAFLWLLDSGTFLFADQSSVVFQGATGKMIVEHLVQRYRSGEPWVSQEYLLHDIVHVKSNRVQDVVKRVEGWRRVILVKGGRCRLNV